MTTFTSDDREEEYKKIVAAAPNQPGYEDAVPIPFAGWVDASPPHIVDSGASVEINFLRGYVSDLEKGLESSLNLNKAQAERQVKELTDDEIISFWKPETPTNINASDLFAFARAVLKEAGFK
jgi:hypothetical protein